MSSDTTGHLAQMANDIGNFFRSEQDRQVAVDAIANHINRYWTNRMRQKLLEYVGQGGADLDDLPRAAVAKVVVTPTAGGTAPTPGHAPGSTPEQHQ